MLRLRFDETDRQAVGAARRYGVNMEIQGTSADILKLALRRLHNSLRGSSAILVNIVHDEIVVECDEDSYHQTSLALGKAMSEAGGEFITRVPVNVDARVSDAWAK